MWRDLTQREKEAMHTARRPLSKAVTFIEIFILLFLAIFAVSNLVTLISDRTNGAAISLAIDLALMAIVLVLAPRVRKLLSSDVEEGELVICEAVIDELQSDTISASVVTNVAHREARLAFYAVVHPIDTPEERYKIKIDVDNHSRHKAGDKVLLVCSKDEIDPEYMQLLEVK